MEMNTLKEYLRVDYADDDAIIQLMLDAVLDEMEELIPSFNRKELTKRQQLLVCSYVKELYDGRGNMTATQEKLRYTVQSMMLKEMLR